jgi:hypothetical protein
MKTGQRGRSPGEVIFAVIVFASLLIALYVLLRPKRGGAEGDATLTPKSRYKCMTNADGLIPLKAVVVPREGAMLFGAPNASPTGTRLPMFESYFPLHERDGCIELTNDPTSEKSIGWVRRNAVLLWGTREALRPNRENTERKPLRLWNRLQEVGKIQPEFEEDLESDPPKPFPVLGKSGRSFEIAMTWQSSDYSGGGVATAWTSPVEIPDDARFFCLVTRPELQHALQGMTAALIDLSSGSHAENPIVKLLKGNVEITAGAGTDTADDDVGVLRKILRDLQNPLKIATMQSSDMRRESANMKRHLDRLIHFYLNSDNFDARGIGWIPEQDLPGN